MSKETLQLITQPSLHEISVHDAVEPYDARTHTADFNMLVGIQTNDTVFRVDQAFSQAIVPNGHRQMEHITLSSDKAARLITLIKRMNTWTHGMDCHDIVIRTEGWDDEEDLMLDTEIVTPNHTLNTGQPYQVLIGENGSKPEDLFFTHSAIGTDEGRLLSVTGLNLPLGTMDVDTTLRIHSRGLTPHLAAISLATDDEPTFTTQR